MEGNKGFYVGGNGETREGGNGKAQSPEFMQIYKNLAGIKERVIKTIDQPWEEALDSLEQTLEDLLCIEDGVKKKEELQSLMNQEEKEEPQSLMNEKEKQTIKETILKLKIGILEYEVLEINKAKGELTLELGAMIKQLKTTPKDQLEDLFLRMEKLYERIEEFDGFRKTALRESSILKKESKDNEKPPRGNIKWN